MLRGVAGWPAQKQGKYRNGFVSTDIGIALHELLEANKLDNTVFLSPSTMDSPGSSEGNSPSLEHAMILSLCDIPASDLSRIKVWTVKAQSKLCVEKTLEGIGKPAKWLMPLVPGLFHDIFSSRRYTVQRADTDSQQKQSLLAHFEVEGLVEHEKIADTTYWGFTKKGLSKLQFGLELHKCRRMMVVRPSCRYIEMTTWELISSMLANKWNIIVWKSKTERKELKTVRYVHGGPKNWYVNLDKDLDRTYMIALLTAGEHGKTVPAIGGPKELREICGMTGNTRKRKQEFGEDEWPDDMRTKKPRKSQHKGKAKRKGVAKADSSMSSHSDSSADSSATKKTVSVASSSSSSPHPLPLFWLARWIVVFKDRAAL